MENIVAVALSKRYAMFTSLNTRFLGFDVIKDLYENDVDFATIYQPSDMVSFGKFNRLDGSMCELQVKEAHRGGLIGDFWVIKTL